MSLAHIIKINTTQIKTTAEQRSTEMNFTAFISYFSPNIIHLPDISPNESCLWILLNRRYIANADTLSIHAIKWNVITSIEHALQYQFFQMMYKTLMSYGIYVDETNCAFLLFNLFTWIKNNSYINLQLNKQNISDNEDGMSFIEKHPNYPQNTNAFLAAYNTIMAKSKNEKVYNINNAFSNRNSLKKFTVTL